MNSLIQSMLALFANNFTYYLKAHNFHWIVMGPNFPQYHEFLEEIYSDAQGAIDTYAEQLRRIGAFPQGDYRDIVNNSQLTDPATTNGDPVAMFQSLLSDNEIIVASLQDAFDLATENREHGLANFIADRIDAHRKQQWMINAILANQPAVDQVQPTQPGLTGSPEACPIATQDIGVNLENRQNAIDTAAYGPLNPELANRTFWIAKADMWNTDVVTAKQSLCGNCSFFVQTTAMLDCIETGLAAGGATGNEWDSVGGGQLGYCEAFDFKCKSTRTCDAWVSGGPVTDSTPA